MTQAQKTTTVLLVGVGGQGTILAGDLLAKTAAASGYDVKISEIHGMSQRGGSVSTVVRFGDDVASMICDEGCSRCHRELRGHRGLARPSVPGGGRRSPFR